MLDPLRIQRELSVTTLKPEGLMDRAYAQLRDAVIDGDLHPGEPLYEIHLADRLGMSRTPVRSWIRLRM